MIVELVSALIVAFGVFALSFYLKKTSVLFLSLIPLFVVFENIYIKLLPDNIVLFCFLTSAFLISAFPLIFLFNNFDKSLGLLIFTCVLMQWDWIVTWFYVFNNSAAELNALINVSNFWIFSLQKLSPLLLLGVMFYVARNEERLIKTLDIAMVVVSVGYYLLFVWHLYVVSVVSISLYYLLLIALFTGAFSVTGLIKPFSRSPKHHSAV